MKIEELAQKPEIGGLWKSDGIKVLRGTKAHPSIRVAFAPHHLLVEIDGEAGAYQQDDRPFRPRPDNG